MSSFSRFGQTKKYMSMCVSTKKKKKETKKFRLPNISIRKIGDDLNERTEWKKLRLDTSIYIFEETSYGNEKRRETLIVRKFVWWNVSSMKIIKFDRSFSSRAITDEVFFSPRSTQRNRPIPIAFRRGSRFISARRKFHLFYYKNPGAPAIGETSPTSGYSL